MYLHNWVIIVFFERILAFITCSNRQGGYSAGTLTFRRIVQNL